MLETWRQMRWIGPCPQGTPPSLSWEGVREKIGTEYGLQKVLWLKMCRREVGLTRGRWLWAQGISAEGQAAEQPRAWGTQGMSGKLAWTGGALRPGAGRRHAHGTENRAYCGPSDPDAPPSASFCFHPSARDFSYSCNKRLLSTYCVPELPQRLRVPPVH